MVVYHNVHNNMNQIFSTLIIKDGKKITNIVMFPAYNIKNESFQSDLNRERLDNWYKTKLWLSLMQKTLNNIVSKMLKTKWNAKNDDLTSSVLPA